MLEENHTKQRRWRMFDALFQELTPQKRLENLLKISLFSENPVIESFCQLKFICVLHIYE